MSVSGQVRRLAMVVVCTLGLGACGAYLQDDVMNRSFWGGGPFSGSKSADELGLAAMAKGDYQRAEKHFQTALRADPKNPYALLGMGIIAQNTGQQTKAREMYEAILAIRPDKKKQLVVWNNMTTRPLADIASVNLALLESGGVLSDLGRGAAGQDGGQFMPPDMAAATGSPQGIGGAAQGSAMFGRPDQGMQASRGGGRASRGTEPASLALSGGDANIISRFETLKALLDQGLITEEEYKARRQANIGALLPLTSPPPAAGLDRPVPSTEQISSRLRAISRALEMRAISVSQHASERQMILDALMPDAPAAVAKPGPPPQGLMQAADAVRRLEYLRDEGLITSDEYAKERAAIEQAMQAQGAMPGTVGGQPAGDGSKAMDDGGGPARASGPQPAVHIASYRSEKVGERGWTQVRRAHRSLLGDLSHDLARVNLGPGKGVFYRLKAGPLPSKQAAKDLCRKLKRRGQYCEPSFMNTN